jgi:hypothetical protein
MLVWKAEVFKKLARQPGVEEEKQKKMGAIALEMGAKHIVCDGRALDRG